MPSIFVEIKIPELLREHFEQHDFKPFERLILSYSVDTDGATVLVQELLTEIKYQKQRDEKLEQDNRKMA